jgi:uncharacterized FlgJ-related protein
MLRPHVLALLAGLCLLAACAQQDTEQPGIPSSPTMEGPKEVMVFGSVESIIQFLQDENWWGEVTGEQIANVPRILITGIAPRWQKAAQEITVPEKKEIFYRFMLPLALRANEIVRDRRVRLIDMAGQLRDEQGLAANDLEWLQQIAVGLRIKNEDEAQALGGDAAAQLAVIDEALYKLDEIPAGLVLGQAAYESGYGTSRFAVEGNALFGQWTYGGEGMVPEKQRKSLGDHRIASYDWPFDSVRGYYINISSHPAYEDLRKLRAQLKADGKPLTSLALADGLQSYSERGQAYVDTLKGIIRTNGLDRADAAAFRDEPIRFIVTADNDEEAAELRDEVDELRNTGELDRIVARMRLE